MATQPIYQFLDDKGVQVVIDNILDVVEEKIIKNTIVDKIDPNDPETVSDSVMASSKAIVDFIHQVDGVINDFETGTKQQALDAIDRLREDARTQATALTHLSVKLVFGPPETISEPRSDILYLCLVKPNTWYMYVNTEERGWLVIGKSDYELNLWDKETCELEKAMLEFAITPMRFRDIKNAVWEAAISQNILDQDLLERLEDLRQ